MSRVKFPQTLAATPLFPFVAVLLCTMGSLLVLMVAVARSSRDHALGQVAAERTAALENSPETITARQELERIRAIIEKLSKVRSEASQQLHDDQLRLSHMEDHMRRLQDRLESLRHAAEELQALENGHNDDREQARLEVERLEQLIAESRQNIDQLRQEVGTKARAFEIVPYEGKNGTHRPPIFIECREDEAILQPEGIRLTLEDFDGPAELGNPLATALRAAREAAVAKNPNGLTSDAEPYPLIIVRPRSSEMFVKVTRVVEHCGFDFGYELVDSDWKLKFPPANPELAAVEARAIELARARMQILASAAPRAFGNEDDDGSYYAMDEPDDGPPGGVPGTGDLASGGTGQGGPADGGSTNGSPTAGGTATGGSGSGGPIASGTGYGIPGYDPSSSGAPAYGPAGSNGSGTGTGAGGVSTGPRGTIIAIDSESTFGTADGQAESDRVNVGQGSNGNALRGPAPRAAGQPLTGGGNGTNPGQYQSPSKADIGTSPENVGAGPIAGADGKEAAGPPASILDPGATTAKGPSGIASGQSVPFSDTSSGMAGDTNAVSPDDTTAASMRAAGSSARMGSHDERDLSDPDNSATRNLSVSNHSSHERPDPDDPKRKPQHIHGNDWAITKGPGSVPIRRTIRVVVRGDRLAILPEGAAATGANSGKEIPLTGSTGAALDDFAGELRGRVKDWGMAGNGLYWRPVLELNVAPDGQRRADDLTRLLKNSGIEVRIATTAKNTEGAETSAAR